MQNKELEMGKKVETEHKRTILKILHILGTSPESEKGKKVMSVYSEMIAQDHIDEIENYYTLLKKMEEDAKNNVKKSIPMFSLNLNTKFLKRGKNG